jgi:hypothetical protein
MDGTALGFGSLAIALANAAWLFARIRRVASSRNRLAHDLSWAAAAVLGLAAFARGVGWPGGVAAAAGIAVGGFMLLLRLGSPQARTTSAVAVGGPILDFNAPDENGAPFSLASLAGRPFLLKFFRGHW